MFEKLGDWPEYAGLFADLVSNWEAIRDEGLALMENGRFVPWREPDLYDGNWDVFGIFWAGRELERRSAAPLTRDILGAWQPSALNGGFSLLRPGTEIKPHIGYTSEVIRLHLGLDIPESDANRLGIKVGEEARGWANGELMLFDDTIEHSAWNRCDKARMILLVDLRRPEGKKKEARG